MSYALYSWNVLPSLLYILTSFQVLYVTESWSKYFLSVFGHFFYFAMGFFFFIWEKERCGKRLFCFSLKFSSDIFCCYYTIIQSYVHHPREGPITSPVSPSQGPYFGPLSIISKTLRMLSAIRALFLKFVYSHVERVENVCL